MLGPLEFVDEWVPDLRFAALHFVQQLYGS
jgi:hypothetical protein